MEKYCFIKTSDAETIQQLISLGYKVMSVSAGVYTFLNDGKMTFDSTNNKIVYSSSLNL